MTPYDFQQRALHALFSYFETHKGNPLVAMPTGTGKSVVIGAFVRDVLRAYPGQKILMLTHVKELISQNATRLSQLWPTAPLGVFSAGLNRREIAPITYAGVASVYRRAEELGHVDLVIIDEAHLLSPKQDSMYQKLFAELKRINNKVKLIGFTATPYRVGQGRLTEDGLFTDVAFDLTSKNEFNDLMRRGYLAPLIPKKTKLQVDISEVAIKQNDFSVADLQKLMDKENVTRAALQEIIETAVGRERCLIFTTGIDHTEHVAEQLRDVFGETAVGVHSKSGNEAREQAINDFRDGRVRFLVNANIFTTGFDMPQLDCIAVLRHTTSTGLWVQMLGRGTRPAPGKRDCLVLDFANNTERLGPINDPVLPKKRGKALTAKEAKETRAGNVKTCQACLVFNERDARYCTTCGAEFTGFARYGAEASTAPLVAEDAAPPPLTTLRVHRVIYTAHEKQNKEPKLAVHYYCGNRRIREWIALENSGYAGHRARTWWRERFDYGGGPPLWTPETVAEALTHTESLRQPKTLEVTVGTPYPEIKSYGYT